MDILEKGAALFNRIGSLKVTDEEIKRLAKVTQNDDVRKIRFVLNAFTNRMREETRP